MRPNSSVSLLEQPFRISSSVPLAFRIAAKSPEAPEREVRLACRDLFRSGKLLGRIIPLIDDVLAAGGIQPPEAPPESVPPAIPNPESEGDVGHRVADELSRGCHRERPAKIAGEIGHLVARGPSRCLYR